MNKKIQILSLLFLGVSQLAFSQIQEERLILTKKREPEVKKIEKKKTSVETIKNYPPEEKSQNPVRYTITDVPAVSDFKTSTIQGEDVAPKFEANQQRNYAQFGFGNYSKILGDANVSYILENKMEVGVDAHVLSTTGLKNEYAWDSRQNAVNLGAFLNGYGEKGKFNFNADYGLNDYNYYGIYAFEPSADTNLKQKVSQFKANGYYDFYSNEILNDARVKTSFLSDKFNAKETQAAANLNLSKHGVELGGAEALMNADFGVGIEHLNTKFDLLNENASQFFVADLSPKLTFSKGDIDLMIGSNFSFLNSTISSSIVDKYKSNKTYWFPKAELQYSKNPEFKVYVGIDGGLKMNSYGELLTENPYLVSDQILRPTETKYNFYFGLKGDLDETVKYDVSVGYAKMRDIAFFNSNNLFNNTFTLNRPAYDYANTFSVIYDNGTVSRVKGSLQYFPLENLVIDGELGFQKYDLENYDDINYKPVMTASLGAKYTMLDKKLNLGFKAFLVGNRTANSFVYDEVMNPANPGTSLYQSSEYRDDLVKSYADLNLSAEYRFHKNFSIFALGNNLLNNKYQTFKGYKVLGAQFLGGIKVTF